MLHQHFCSVAGVMYEGRQPHIKALVASDPVKVVPEPDNQHDKQAHAVYAGHSPHKIGYIPRKDLVDLYPLLVAATSIQAKIWEFLEGSPDANGSRGVRIHLTIETPESPESTRAAPNEIFKDMQATPERDGD